MMDDIATVLKKVAAQGEQYSSQNSTMACLQGVSYRDPGGNLFGLWEENQEKGRES